MKTDMNLYFFSAIRHDDMPWPVEIPVAAPTEQMAREQAFAFFKVKSLELIRVKKGGFPDGGR